MNPYRLSNNPVWFKALTITHHAIIQLFWCCISHSVIKISYRTARHELALWPRWVCWPAAPRPQSTGRRSPPGSQHEARPSLSGRIPEEGRFGYCINVKCVTQVSASATVCILHLSKTFHDGWMLSNMSVDVAIFLANKQKYRTFLRIQYNNYINTRSRVKKSLWRINIRTSIDLWK